MGQVEFHNKFHRWLDMNQYEVITGQLERKVSFNEMPKVSMLRKLSQAILLKKKIVPPTP